MACNAALETTSEGTDGLTKFQIKGWTVYAYQRLHLSIWHGSSRIFWQEATLPTHALKGWMLLCWIACSINQLQGFIIIFSCYYEQNET